MLLHKIGVYKANTLWQCANRKQKKKKKLDSQGFDPRTSRMLSGRATKCTTNPLVDWLEGEHVSSSLQTTRITQVPHSA